MYVSGGCVCLLEDKGSLVDSYVVMRGAMGHPIESINKRHFVHIEEAENADCTLQCTNIIVTRFKANTTAGTRVHVSSGKTWQYVYTYNKLLTKSIIVSKSTESEYNLKVLKNNNSRLDACLLL